MTEVGIMFSQKFFTGMLIAILIAAAAMVTFQTLEMVSLGAFGIASK